MSKQRRFTKEFEAEAVRLIETSARHEVFDPALRMPSQQANT
jgi:hypothetical protein